MTTYFNHSNPTFGFLTLPDPKKLPFAQRPMKEAAGYLSNGSRYIYTKVGAGQVRYTLVFQAISTTLLQTIEDWFYRVDETFFSWYNTVNVVISPNRTVRFALPQLNATRRVDGTWDVTIVLEELA